ncbi:hypothetical protein QAD02_014267 [Eretmocerus hayati]|uniref:Uncharacterized protein n=1 Tax=Eretmocerus hayati TaxID=131215 RepID=A0ACC2P9N0_9HYME|nr:hypothetical protein QAD02_014267 [Eretmocerus hayati]
MSKKGGYYCAFKDCRGLSRRDKRSFFRFPKDPQRSKQWVRACERDDLLEKTPIELFNSYRVCAKHFTDSMFLNDLRNRLQPNSVPIQCKSSKLPDDVTEVAEEIDEPFTDGDPVSKILSNCVLQKISADEFFKATGICINESESAVKAAKGYLLNSSSPDHSYSNIRANNEINISDIPLSVDIDNEMLNSFTIGSLSYQDLINSLPASLIGAPNTESLSLESNLSFVISDKTIDIEELPENIMEGQDGAIPIMTAESIPEPLEETSQVDYHTFKNFSEESTQTEFDLKYKIDSTSQTETSSALMNLEDSTQTNIEKLIAGTKRKIENSEMSKQQILEELCENKSQKLDLQIELRKHFLKLMDDITLEQFELLTEKFFPKEASNFIKVQAQLFKKKNSDRKYSAEFKKQCLELFLASPKTYKNLQKIFCLPAIRDLQSLKI